MAITEQQWLELVDAIGDLYRRGKKAEEIATTLNLKVSLIIWIIHDNDHFVQS
jgi:hypothetical protein